MSKFEEHLPSTADDEKLARMLQSEWEDEQQRQAELYHTTPMPTGGSAAAAPPSAAVTEDEKLARKLQAEFNHEMQEENRAAAAAAAARTTPPPKQVSFAAPTTRGAPPPPPPQMSGALSSSPSDIQYSRDTARVMAYMIPLPQPLNKNGTAAQEVPQRYMLYMPPKADLLKPTDKNAKERKRDKAVRRWQQEVRKAKTYNGRVVSLGGMHSVSIRGAVWVLSVIKPADVTFLSRVPRKTVQSLVLVHPESPSAREDEMFRNVRDELSRTKKRTRRDFWIGTALLPITFTIDLVIPVFGGLSEVNMVWMAVNASAWMTANKVVDKLRPAAAAAQGNGYYPGYQEQQHGGAMMLRRSHTVDGSSTGSGADGKARDGGGEEYQQVNEKGGGGGSKKKKEDDTIQMVFQPSPAMDLMRRYVDAACHRRNPDAFPSPGDGYVPGEAEVLASMGWSPEHREVADAEQDVAWQIRKVTEDLREATDRAAKSWDSWCKKYIKNPKKAAEEERDEDREVDGDDDSDSSEEEDWKPELPKRPPVLYK